MSAYDSLAEFYDQLTQDVDYDKFALFYESIFKAEGLNIKTILDLACGTGTLSCIMAKRGYEMIAVDGSTDMLSAAMAKFSCLSGCEPPLVLNQMMDELDLYGTVDAAVCMLDGFNYLPEDALIETLRRLRLFIEPGGILIFDINTPYKLRGLDGQLFIDETEEVYCVWRAEFDEDENACYYGMDIFAEYDGLWERSFEEHIEYAYEPEYLIKLLEEAGFESIKLYGELSFEPPRENENRIFFSARNPKI
ncbi:MAG: class I SAM-dependent methyltransferase [Ruminococcaceae bacterium]|nr:class I SAM-dependent methyltransferase [Oscillospiraceae bacterium]